MAAGFLALGVQNLVNAASLSSSVHRQPCVTGKYVLRDAPPLGHGIRAGMGSGLVHLPEDPENVYYTITDRGPNVEVKVGDEKRRTFPLEKFTPTIYKVTVRHGEMRVIQSIPLKLKKGQDPVTGTDRITGLPNVPQSDETPYNREGTKPLPFDPYGLDTEGITYNPRDHTFWLCEEYRPSLVHVKQDGTILERIVPKGEAKNALAPYIPVKERLPSVFSKRNQNRGFEGVTVTPDGKWLYTMVQSPLANPDQKAAKSSRTLRVIKMDLKRQKVVAEYPYLTDDARLYQGLNQYDVMVSDMYAVAEDHIIVDERDKNSIKKLYLTDFSNATNLLLGQKDRKTRVRTLEQMSVDELKQAGIHFPSKRLLVDLISLNYPYEKVEGITMPNSHTIALINDNDFGIGDASGVDTELWTIDIRRRH
ncbi:esterase-like activity of phytase family protein [Polycladomyces subterraneus]|uniref:Esterase-like activity of phytase family protein n=1 Tax=Polycladomyces subterraneus TaxID=1016997 RepID=A0ABT8IND9_9BACL|nr:esterase-like activity of phytase family protein [Polycladomyces subterraneus]MDN4594309.1 esterase-like activity of phytase family protein [Polycladomyces subterraneus]